MSTLCTQSLQRYAQVNYYMLNDLQEIHELSHFMAQFFPQQGEAITGIHELLMNAVEHGNLELGFELKARLLREDRWEREVRQRLLMPRYAKKEVMVRLEQDANACYLTIADEGKGFDWQYFLQRTPDLRHPNGRGLLIARSSLFDDLRFNAAGNAVTCVVKRHSP